MKSFCLTHPASAFNQFPRVILLSLPCLDAKKMAENMSILVNGESQVPPGFRFHPTEEELLQYYLKKKVSNQKIDLDVIRDVDLNKLEPWDIQEECKIGTTPQNDWYFFSHKDKKYPTGTRTNRATMAGFWKATGRDKVIYSFCRRIGMRKTLVFYKGRAPHGLKSDWIMHEYRLDDNSSESKVSIVVGETAQEEGWVVCRIFKKKNRQKTLDCPISSISLITGSKSQIFESHSNEEDGDFENMLQFIGKSPNEDDDGEKTSFRRNLEEAGLCNNNGRYESRFFKLPNLEFPNCPINGTDLTAQNEALPSTNQTLDSALTNWSAFDRLLASQLNGNGGQTDDQLYSTSDLQIPPLQSFSSLSSIRSYQVSHDYNEVELWSLPHLTKS